MERMYTDEELSASNANMQEIFRVQAEVRRLMRAELMKSIAALTDTLPGTSDRKNDSPLPL